MVYLDEQNSIVYNMNICQFTSVCLTGLLAAKSNFIAKNDIKNDSGSMSFMKEVHRELEEVYNVVNVK